MEYYAVNSRGLAETIKFIGGLDYHAHDHKFYPNKKIYTFEDTPLFREVLSHVTSYSKEFRAKRK